jgi:hypothetical protein
MSSAPDVREILTEIHEMLREAGDIPRAAAVQNALAGPPEALDSFLVSNELWGGAGSIADEGLMYLPQQKKLQQLLVRLGRIQLQKGQVNVRTEMWVSAFAARK